MGLKKCWISSAVGGADVDMLWDGSEEYGDVRSVRNMKALTVKMETVTLMGNGGRV
jgi:hypothetical protein